MNQEARQWLDMAQTDLGVAKHLEANYYPKPLERLFAIIVNRLWKKE